jgi:hypothetical protein
LPDPTDRPDPTTPKRPARAARRRPKFVLPPDVDDPGATERIEAFLEGPTPVARKRRPLHLRHEPLRRPRQPVPMDSRADWEAALRREDHRWARYGRPVAILLVEVRPGDHDALDRIARRVGAIVRDAARATDRVARVGPTRFQALLPETDEAEATALAARIRRACRAESEGMADRRWDVAASVAVPHGGASLYDALRVAERRLGE